MEVRKEAKTVAGGSQNRHAAWAGGTGGFRKLRDVKAEEFPRIPTGLAEFDRVLGGGLVRGSINLIGGDPGIGKSTLLLQTAAALSEKFNVAYVTGEESPGQIALRATRLGLSTSSSPLSVMENTPISFTAPKRFLIARSIRKGVPFSPSK